MPTALVTSALVIRPAIANDAAALAELAASTFRDTYRLIDDLQDIEAHIAEHFQREIVASHIADPASTVLLAVRANRLVGYAHLKQTEPPPCVVGPAPVELVRLYLSQDVIGKGHGAQLMRAVQAEARRRERQTLWLGVYDKNVRAVAFYKRVGFVDVGTMAFVFGRHTYFDPIMAAPVHAIS